MQAVRIACLFYFFPDFFDLFFGKVFRSKLVRDKAKHTEKPSRMTDNVILLRSDQFSADLAIYGPDSAYFSCFFVSQKVPQPQNSSNI